MSEVDATKKKRKDKEDKKEKKDKDDKKDGKEKKERKDKEAKRKEKEDRKREKAREKEEERQQKKNKRRSWILGGMNEGAVDMEEQSSRSSRRQSYRQKEGADFGEMMHKQRELEQFLLNMPVKKLRGTTWKYYDLSPEDGYDETMVVLSSGGCRLEMMYELILGLAREFRVIAPMYPEVFEEMEDYVEGVLLIMRSENVKRAHFYGISFGAMVAHQFIYSHPLRVISCILVHAVIPCEQYAGYMRKAIKKIDTGASHTVPVQRSLTGCSMKGKEFEEQVLDLEFGEKELLVMMIKKFAESRVALLNRLSALLDLHSNVEYSPEKFSRFSGRILLVESEDDPSYDPDIFDQLCALHPNACVHYFSDSGLIMPVVRAKRMIQLIAKFMGDEENESVTTRSNEGATEQTAPPTVDVADVPAADAECTNDSVGGEDTVPDAVESDCDPTATAEDGEEIAE